MPSSQFVAKAIFVAMLILSMSAVVSAQSKGLDPVLLAKAKAGDADAEERVSLSYSRLGNQKESCRWGFIAAQNGNASAQHYLGYTYEVGSTLCERPKDYTQAAVWFRKAAEQGDVVSQEELAVMYDNGQGLPQDHSLAAIWWRKAAEQGDPSSQYNLGIAYYRGQGLPQDYAQAIIWFRKAAELRQGEIAGAPERSRKIMEGTTADAQSALGEAYAYGNGVAQDYGQAAAWYRKAADLGNAYAQRDLGDLYYNGGVIKFVDAPGGGKRGIRDDGGGDFPKDYSLAATWYRKAAEQGDEYSQNSLGILYDNGQGVPQDYAEAYFWYSLASAKQPHLAENRDNAASHLTKTVLLQTQERARKWFEDHPVQTNPQ
jgi:TPR repeat protein